LDVLYINFVDSKKIINKATWIVALDFIKIMSDSHKLN
jgi:hypothetical protein